MVTTSNTQHDPSAAAAPDQPAPTGRLASLSTRMGTAGQLLGMFGRGRRWWMLPLVLLLLLIGIVLVGLQSVQYVAPFIYMVF